MEASPPSQPPAPEPPAGEAPAPDPGGPAPGFDLASAPGAAKVGWIAALLVVIGSFGTWATVEVAGFSSSVGGMDGDGALTLVLAIIGAGAIFMGLRNGSGGWLIGAAVCGALVTLIGIIDFVDVESLGGDIGIADFPGDEDPFSVGWGLYLVIVAGGALTASAAMLRMSSD